MALNKDSDIIREVLDGNVNAFELLLNKYQKRTFGFCFRILKDENIAGEAAHLSFVKAYENLHKFRMDSSFSTWLYRIAYNLCLDQIRFDKKMLGQNDIENHDSWLPNEINAGWDYLNNSDRKKYLELALEKLEPDESVIIFNYYHEEMSIKELSDITGLSYSNIKIKLFRARKKLYKELELMLKDEVESLIR